MLSRIAGWLGPKRDPRLLQAITFLRSAGQGMALVDVSLYLKDLGWGGGAIGAVLAGAGLTRMLGMLFARQGNAYLGSKRFLLLFEALTAIAALAAAAASYPAVLAVALIAAGLGSGHSGSGGPAAPIERRWLAAYSRNGSNRLFHVNALLGSFGMGAGALLGCLPSWGLGSLQGADRFRPLFALIAFVSLLSVALTLCIQGGKRKAAGDAVSSGSGTAGRSARSGAPAAAAANSAEIAGDAPASASPPQARAGRDGPKLLALVGVSAAALAASAVLRRSGFNQLSLFVPIAAFVCILAANAVRLLIRSRSSAPDERATEDLKHLSNVLSGVVVTLTGTMTSYWFSSRFEASAGSIGVVMSLSYIAAGLLSLRGTSSARKPASVRSVLLMQFTAIAFLLAMPWAASFWLAACLEIGCTAFNLGTRGNRTAIMMEEPRRGPRSGFATFYYLLIRIGAVLWPGAFGRWVEAGEYVAPFYIAAGLQAASALLYARVFRRSPSSSARNPEVEAAPAAGE
ncbi:hypothetical protein [Cohnella zeiphila]|uniref:MFS transporter n=1 Tax=Cohnella zeiphila TaxID=2761120 RepID=A0A7X0ST77_9BACL|nr:hypothetical protein [Cohnella zeiphila]MBB6735692.1 hypothetical protein [Cohnella zeiphila]